MLRGPKVRIPGAMLGLVGKPKRPWVHTWGRKDSAFWQVIGNSYEGGKKPKSLCVPAIPTVTPSNTATRVIALPDPTDRICAC